MKQTSLDDGPVSPRRRRRKKIGVLLAGFALVVTGVLLGIIPVIPGTPLTLLGIGMVATHSSRGRLFRWRFGAWLRRRGMKLPARLGGARRQTERLSEDGSCPPVVP